MSRSNSLVGPVSEWDAELSPVPGPTGFPASIDDSESLLVTGMYPITSPVTCDEMMQWFHRIQSFSVTLSADFGADAFSETISILRYPPLSYPPGIITSELQIVGPFETGQTPFWRGMYSSPSGDATVTIQSDTTWFNATTGVTFFNLAVTIEFAVTINGTDYVFVADFNPGVGKTEVGTVELIGNAGRPLLSNYPTTLDLYLGAFIPSAYFPYAKADGTDPIWDATTGAQLRDTDTPNLRE